MELPDIAYRDRGCDEGKNGSDLHVGVVFLPAGAVVGKNGDPMGRLPGMDLDDVSGARWCGCEDGIIR